MSRNTRLMRKLARYYGKLLIKSANIINDIDPITYLDRADAERRRKEHIAPAMNRSASMARAVKSAVPVVEDIVDDITYNYLENDNTKLVDRIKNSFRTIYDRILDHN